ncbi:hypothetical protein EIP86_002584 [Pleurotus ostreatoroseus]|nr:hypothetical protein EIP86_002584 [Pleurotus ostreatoroseus]
MHVEQVQILLPGSLGGLICAANRYTPNQPSPQWGGYTLVFAHCSSAHKEQWNVTIPKLLDLTADSSTIHEAWALDLPSHGDSALLNQEKLRHTRPISVQDYGDLLYYFSCSSYVTGQRLIAVGHSASTAAWCLAWKQSPKPPIEAFILIEPVMVPPPITQDDPRIRRGAHNVKSVLSRLNKWDDMDALAAWMKKRYPWKIWDKRILDIYIFLEVA